MRLSIAIVRHRNSKVRDAVREVVGPVERVDDPQVISVARIRMLFLGQKIMVGKRFTNRRHDRLFRFDVSFGDKSFRLLVLILFNDARR